MMIKQIAATKNTRLLVIGGVLQIIYLLFSIVYFKERIFAADPAHFLFHISGTGNYYYLQRLIVLFSGILPVIGTNLGCSIKMAMMLYSINVALMYFIPFLIILDIFKDRTMAIGLLLFQFIFPIKTHYLAISELQHGLIFLLVYWSYIGYMYRQNKALLKHPATYILLFIIMNAHPLIALAFLGSCLLLSNHKKYWNFKDQKVLMLLAVVFFMITRILFATKYETILITHSLDGIQSHYNIYLFRLMISKLIRLYYSAIIIGGLGLYFLFKNYAWHKVIAVIGIAIINFLFIYLRFHEIGLVETFYEIYLSIIVFSTFLLVALYIEDFSNKFQNWFTFLILALIIFQGVRTINYSTFYKERMALYENVMDQMVEANIEKAILPFYKAPMNKIVDFYCTPFETYLLSQIDDDPKNDGLIVAYWLSDSVDIEKLGQYNASLIRFDIDSFEVFPFTKYPNFDFSDAPFETLEIDY